MGSPLDFISSDGFRKKLITRNLTPYAKSPNRPTPPFNFEYIQSDTSVQDSPDQLIDTPSFANNLFPLNQYGNEGGYKQVPDPNGLLNNKSNEGEYGYQDANIVGQSVVESQKWKPLNVYSNGSQLQLDSAEFFNSLDKPQTTNNYNNQPYPTTFVPSSYNPVSILLSPDPSGSNGFVSQDSFIVKLGAQTLRKEFEARIAAQIRQDTIGRANVLNINSGTDVVNILTGVVPLIEPNYTITVSANPILAATNFALRLAGSILPTSPIPGSYFDPTINTGQPGTIQQTLLGNPRSVVSNFFNKLLGGGQTGSQIFYNNTGAGQKSRLFKNIDFNKYKPNYDRTLLNRLGGALVGATTNNSNFYVGSITSDPSRVFSPGGEVPVNQFGQEQQDAVYGPSELAQLYEGPSKEIRLGANGPTYSNGGGIEGGFTWVSPKYKGNAGKTVGVGGLIVRQDEDFRPSSYNSTESTERTLKTGSLLEKTQRIIDSQPQGGKRLQHVGNAIDQVSKVFNDGYKEMTKGSRVLTYVGSLGNEVGSEYCRVFAKDIPYLQYNDLQKTDGITTEGRRFSDSVLDKTYNLNIAPNKQEGGQSSTNLIGNSNDAYAKKYMFSLENLAWRTSSTPGFTVSDLPICERGPNGGRVMWFAPYGLTFTENTSTNWNQSDFLGRPEPVYTYKNTSRGGSLSWKIVVDHPSVLNVIVNKVLGTETNKDRINGLIDSFFAGCKKYDLYELAKKYYNVPPGDLYLLQEAITSKKVTKEQLQYSMKTIQSGVYGGQGQSTASNIPSDPFKKYEQTGFYFGNDYPKQGTTINYTSEYNRYTSSSNKQYYNSKSPSTAQQTSAFFTNVVEANFTRVKELVNVITKQITESESGLLTLYFNASCSAPASRAYNRELASRRIAASIKYFTDIPELNKFITASPQRLKLVPETALGEETTSQVLQYDEATKEFKPGANINCTDADVNVAGGDTQSGSKDIFTTQSMACRRAYISKVENKLVGKTVPSTTPPTQYIDVLVGNVVTETVTQQELTRQWEQRDNITKYVLRVLLSECDYFETIKEETPMVFDNLKDKLKFFQPAFHSTTPEGLNNRLTFLQQCMRPGDTIPTIKDIGGTQQVQYNNATNTAFGAPPVLILRVGDFYNTKIIPTNLQFQYESLDINPEGIGIQPMIANVTLSFNFVGGSGLKTAVDKLQNALTFNYYANAEIWDDRADVTSQEKFLEVLDNEFLKMDQSPAPPTLNQAEPNNGQDNNNTVGTILTSVVDSGVETGTISYGTFMAKFVTDTQTYFTNVVNKTKETVNQYNNAVRQQWMLERSYTEGIFNVTEADAVIFGKPNNVEKRFDQIFASLEDNIKNGTEGFLQFISGPTKNFSNSVKRTVKENYGNVVKNKRGSYQNAITKITQDLTTIEQSYIQTLGRVNFIAFDGELNTGTDGFQVKSGPTKIYVTTGTDKVSASSNGATDTLEELVNDIVKVQTDIALFNNAVWANSKFIYSSNSKEYEGVLVFETAPNGISKEVTVEDVFNPFSTNENFTNNVFRRVYMIMSDDVLDEKKYQTFKTAMIGNIINKKGLFGNGNSDELEAAFDEYWIGTARPAFLEENNITKAFIENLEKTTLKNFLIYTPFDTKKTREFTFTTVNNAAESVINTQQNLIKGLGASSNQNTNNNTWCDLNGNAAGGYISKAKLN